MHTKGRAKLAAALVLFICCALVAIPAGCGSRRSHRSDLPPREQVVENLLFGIVEQDPAAVLSTPAPTWLDGTRADMPEATDEEIGAVIVDSLRYEFPYTKILAVQYRVEGKRGRHQRRLLLGRVPGNRRLRQETDGHDKGGGRQVLQPLRDRRFLLSEYLRERSLLRKMTPPYARLAALVLVLALLVPGCGKTGRSEVTGGGVFNAFLMEPASLDPARLQSPMELQVARQIFKGLTDYNPDDMETIPAMADSWTASADATVWTFSLRQGVSFQNGRECTAQDFVYSWNRVADPRTDGPAAYHFAPIKGFRELQEGSAGELAGLRAIDDYTLEVTLEYPYADFPARVAHPAFAPVPREEVTDDFGEHPVGTGPFRLVRWEHQVELVIEKFPGYFGENQPDLDQVVFKIYPDIEAGWRDFKAGVLDDAQIPPGQYDVASVEFGDRALFKPLLSTLFCGFDMEAEPWRGNEDFRRGLNWAIDRELLSTSIMQGTASAATGMVAQGAFGYQSSAMPYRYDPEKAKGLLAKDFPDNRDVPTGLTLVYNSDEHEELVAQSVQSDLGQVGVELSIAGYPSDVYAGSAPFPWHRLLLPGMAGGLPYHGRLPLPAFYSR